MISSMIRKRFERMRVLTIVRPFSLFDFKETSGIKQAANQRLERGYETTEITGSHETSQFLSYLGYFQ